MTRVRWRRLARLDGLSPRAIRWMSRRRQGKCTCVHRCGRRVTVRDLAAIAWVCGAELDVRFVRHEEDDR